MFVYHHTRREVDNKGATAQLTKTEAAIFECLLKHQNHNVRKEVIELEVFGEKQTCNVVNCHIVKIREKLRDIGLYGLIKTVRGLGYRLDTTRLEN